MSGMGFLVWRPDGTAKIMRIGLPDPEIRIVEEKEMSGMKCLIHNRDLESTGDDWFCPQCNSEIEKGVVAMTMGIDNTPARIKNLRERISIRYMKDTFDYFSGKQNDGEQLVLCIDDQVIPFQCKSDYVSDRSSARFVVTFECFEHGLAIK